MAPLPSSRVVVLLGATLLAGCSLMTWDLDNMPCSEARECLEGYSCLGETCKLDHTIGENERCTLPRQCLAGLTCPSFVCVAVCTDFYGGAGCASGQYCAPVLDAATATVGGACSPWECAADADCPGTNAICVALTPSASACARACIISWVAAAYADDCASLEGEDPSTCQPLGMSPQQRLVCLPARGEQPESVSCTLASETCAAGLACVDGTCRAYCDPGGAPCAGGLTCVEQAATTPFALCE